MNATTYKVGDFYYQASAILNGINWDMDATPQPTEELAQAEADDWMAWLSHRERPYARTYVNRYRVVEIDEDGGIACAVTDHQS